MVFFPLKLSEPKRKGWKENINQGFGWWTTQYFWEHFELSLANKCFTFVKNLQAQALWWWNYASLEENTSKEKWWIIFY